MHPPFKHGTAHDFPKCTPINRTCLVDSTSTLAQTAVFTAAYVSAASAVM